MLNAELKLHSAFIIQKSSFVLRSVFHAGTFSTSGAWCKTSGRFGRGALRRSMDRLLPRSSRSIGRRWKKLMQQPMDCSATAMPGSSLSQRIAILEKAAALMQAQRDELALEAAREGGKPLIDSRVEADRAIDGIKLCVQHLRTQAGSEIPMNLNAASAGRLAFTQHEPIGVVVAFSAFNHPLNLIVHQVGPAIAAGCPVIVKPAKATPLSCFRLVNILRQAGLPDEWCQALVTADNNLATEMVADRRLGFFSFIGSGRVGWELASKLAPGARCSLEHGGVAPVIVAADADVDNALPLLAKGGFYHAGQVCVSVQRVYVDKKIARSFAERLAGIAEALKVGDPTLPDTEVGPLIRASEVKRVDEWVQEAIANVAEAIVRRKGDFVPPLRANGAIRSAGRRAREHPRGLRPGGVRLSLRKSR